MVPAYTYSVDQLSRGLKPAVQIGPTTTMYATIDVLASSIDGEELFFLTVLVVAVFVAGSFRKSPHRCPRCRELNREQAQFCAQCGTKLSKR